MVRPKVATADHGQFVLVNTGGTNVIPALSRNLSLRLFVI